MAYLMQSEKDQEEQGQGQAAGGTQLGSGNALIGGGSGASAGASSSSSSQAKRPASTGYVNIQRYLDGNKGQTAGMAQGISDKISTTASEGKTGVDTAGSTFKTMADQAGPSDASDMISQIKADPTKVNAGAFSSAVGQSYGGPKTLAEVQGYDDSASKVRQAESMTNAWGTSGGRKDNLAETYKRPQYSKGMIGLDQSLLQADDTAIAKAKADNEQYGKLTEYLGAADKAAGETVSAKQQLFDDRRTALTGAVDSTVASQRAAMQDRLTKEQEKRNWEFDKLGMQATSFDPAGRANIMASLGYRGDEAGYVNPLDYNNLSKYFSKGSDLGMSDVTNGEDLARLSALQSLGGKGADFVTQSTQPANAAYTFNKSAYDRDVSNVKAEKAAAASAAAAAAAQKAAAEKALAAQKAADAKKTSAAQSVTKSVSNVPTDFFDPRSAKSLSSIKW